MRVKPLPKLKYPEKIEEWAAQVTDVLNSLTNVCDCGDRISVACPIHGIDNDKLNSLVEKQTTPVCKHCEERCKETPQSEGWEEFDKKFGVEYLENDEEDMEDSQVFEDEDKADPEKIKSFIKDNFVARSEVEREIEVSIGRTESNHLTSEGATIRTLEKLKSRLLGE